MGGAGTRRVKSAFKQMQQGQSPENEQFIRDALTKKRNRSQVAKNTCEKWLMDFFSQKFNIDRTEMGHDDLRLRAGAAKTIPSMYRKLINDYEGDISKIRDGCRFQVFTHNIRETKIALKAFTELFEKAQDRYTRKGEPFYITDSVRINPGKNSELKNFAEHPKGWGFQAIMGYFEIKANNNEWADAEVQVFDHSMREVEKQTHDLYETVKNETEEWLEYCKHPQDYLDNWQDFTNKDGKTPIETYFRKIRPLLYPEVSGYEKYTQSPETYLPNWGKYTGRDGKTNFKKYCREIHPLIEQQIEKWEEFNEDPAAFLENWHEYIDQEDGTVSFQRYSEDIHYLLHTPEHHQRSPAAEEAFQKIKTNAGNIENPGDINEQVIKTLRNIIRLWEDAGIKAGYNKIWKSPFPSLATADAEEHGQDIEPLDGYKHDQELDAEVNEADSTYRTDWRLQQ